MARAGGVIDWAANAANDQEEIECFARAINESLHVTPTEIDPGEVQPNGSGPPPAAGACCAASSEPTAPGCDPDPEKWCLACDAGGALSTDAADEEDPGRSALSLGSTITSSAVAAVDSGGATWIKFVRWPCLREIRETITPK